MRPEYDMMSKYKLRNNINKEFDAFIQNLTIALENVPYVCTTADIWSVHHRSYLGMTIHWIDHKDLKRKSSALACKRFKSPHNNHRIADLIELIHTKFEIRDKVVATVTDNASNFSSAFKNYGNAMNSSNFDSDTESESSDDENIDKHYQNEKQCSFSIIDMPSLPTHLQCGSHKLNLIANSDAAKLLSPGSQVYNKSYEKKHNSAFEKLNSLWSRASRSNKAHEEIHDILGANIVIPNKTRWNSEFDSIENILKYDKSKLELAMERLSITKFTENDLLFLKTYKKIMEPIATGIDLLQSDNFYYGVLLPTLHTIRDQLNEMKGDKSIEICLPLLNVVLSGLEKRFNPFFDIKNELCRSAILATCCHPYFKMDWISIDNSIADVELRNFIQDILIKEAEQMSTHSRSNNSEQQNVESSTTKRKFQFTFEKNRQSTRTHGLDVRAEVLSFLNSTTEGDENSFQQFDTYPTIRQIFVKYNTLLPSSAAVERLFSLGSKYYYLNL